MLNCVKELFKTPTTDQLVVVYRIWLHLQVDILHRSSWDWHSAVFLVLFLYCILQCSCRLYMKIIRRNGLCLDGKCSAHHKRICHINVATAGNSDTVHSYQFHMQLYQISQTSQSFVLMISGLVIYAKPRNVYYFVHSSFCVVALNLKILHLRWPVSSLVHM